MQRAGSRVKVHYIGYNDSSDEWHELGDIVTTNTRDPANTRKCITQVQPYSLYKKLGIKIKQALVCGRKQSPVVKISFGFDYLLFKGGLQQLELQQDVCRDINGIKLNVILTLIPF